MLNYLIDVNLPYYFSLWKDEKFIHQKDLNDEWTDNEIWKYAKLNQLTILTKDVDFSKRILNSTPPPKVIHFKTGNMKTKEFRNFLVGDNKWKRILEISKEYKLTTVFLDRIEAHN